MYCIVDKISKSSGQLATNFGNIGYGLLCQRFLLEIINEKKFDKIIFNTEITGFEIVFSKIIKYFAVIIK